MVHYDKRGVRVGKVHNDPTSGSPSRTQRRIGTKSLRRRGKRR